MARYSRLRIIGSATITTGILGIIAWNLATFDRQEIPDNPDIVGPTYELDTFVVLLLVFGAVLLLTYIAQQLPPILYWHKTVDEDDTDAE